MPEKEDREFEENKWVSVMSETKDKPKGHRVKEKEGRGGEWSIARGFKIINGKILLI